MKPENLLIFYGWLNSFNSAINGWDNEKVSQDLAKYDLIVLGDGIQETSHGDYANSCAIINRVKEIKPFCKIFGYVTVNQTMNNFVDKANKWNNLEIDGIFMDEAGYDFGKKRDEFNERVDYIHSLLYANVCFANAWNLDHILGTVEDASYQNSIYNENGVESNLDEDDYCLLESYPVNTTAYTSNNGYEPKADWKARGDKAILLRQKYGCKMVGSCIIADGDNNEEDYFQFGYVSAIMYSLDGFGSSDTNYGASSAKTKYYSRPDISKIGEYYCYIPVIFVDGGDNDIYIRYVESGILKVDFSDGQEDSFIINI